MRIGAALVGGVFAVAGLAEKAVAQGWVDVTPAGYPATFQPSTGCFDPILGSTVVLGSLGPNPSTLVHNGLVASLAGPPPNSFQRPYFDPHYGTVQVSSGLSASVYQFNGSTWAINSCHGIPSTFFSSSAFDYSRNVSIHIAATGQAYGPPYIGLAASASPICPSYTLAQPATQYLGQATVSAYDWSSQRVTMFTNGSSIRTYEWNGSNFIQRFPTYPLQASGGFTTFPMLNALSTLAPSSQPSGALLTAYTVTTGGIVPRTFRYRNGMFSEQFLTSYPPESTNTVYVYDSNRDVFLAFLQGSIWELNLGPSAQFSTFGAGCLGSRSTPSLAPQQGSLPRIGTNFTLQALNLPLAGPVFLALGASDTLYGPTPLPLNLGPLGAPQCNLLVGIDNLYSTSNVLGAAAWTFPIPNIPGGIFFSQAVVFDPPANTFGITLSNGGRGVVGS